MCLPVDRQVDNNINSPYSGIYLERKGHSNWYVINISNNNSPITYTTLPTMQVGRGEGEGDVYEWVAHSNPRL